MKKEKELLRIVFYAAKEIVCLYCEDGDPMDDDSNCETCHLQKHNCKVFNKSIGEG